MTGREAYIHRRLMELALLTDNRPLEEIEKDEERALIKELEEMQKANNGLRIG